MSKYAMYSFYSNLALDLGLDNIEWDETSGDAQILAEHIRDLQQKISDKDDQINDLEIRLERAKDLFYDEIEDRDEEIKILRDRVDELQNG